MRSGCVKQFWSIARDRLEFSRADCSADEADLRAVVRRASSVKTVVKS